MKTHKLSKLAESDLDDIYSYTLREWVDDQFEIYRNAFNKALDRLAHDPFLVNSKQRDDLYRGCRTYRVNKHYIAYMPSETGIYVGRFLHEKMEFSRQILNEFFEDEETS